MKCRFSVRHFSKREVADTYCGGGSTIAFAGKTSEAIKSMDSKAVMNTSHVYILHGDKWASATVGEYQASLVVFLRSLP